VRRAGLAVAAALAAAGCGSSSSGGSTTPTSSSPPSTNPPGVSGSSASEGAQRSANVPIKGFKFVPATIKLKGGGRITWVNRDSAPHTATAKDHAFDTGTLQQGQSKTITLKRPGTYAYICTVHPFMQGTVVVVG
jgi:plastocyanin